MTKTITIDRYAAGRVAFEAYAAVLATTGELVCWCDLDDVQTEAWCAAAVAAISYQASRDVLAEAARG